MREGLTEHTKLQKCSLELNAINVKDMEEVQRHCRRNRESQGRAKLPQFEVELKNLITNNR